MIRNRDPTTIIKNFRAFNSERTDDMAQSRDLEENLIEPDSLDAPERSRMTFHTGNSFWRFLESNPKLFSFAGNFGVVAGFNYRVSEKY